MERHYSHLLAVKDGFVTGVTATRAWSTGVIPGCLVCCGKVCGMVWYGMVWYGMVWCGKNGYGKVWYIRVWYGMAWYIRVWLCSVAIVG